MAPASRSVTDRDERSAQLQGTADATPPAAARHTRVSRRAASVTPSATLAIDAKAKALKQSGADVIGFGAGEPDFPTPPEIVEAAVAACRDPRNHRYTPTPGLPELREAIAAKTRRDSGYEVAASQVLVTNGGKHAIANAFAALLDPGDEVLVPAPYWTTYPESIGLAGGTPIVVPTDISTGFKVSAGDLEAHASERTKVLLFVSPSNPTGAVYSARGDGRDRRAGARAGVVGAHRRDLRAPRLRRRRAALDPRRRARSRRPLRGGQRRRQDLRHDGLACRLDDRPAGRGRRGRPTSSRTRPRTSATSPSAPPSPRSRVGSRPWR